MNGNYSDEYSYKIAVLLTNYLSGSETRIEKEMFSLLICTPDGQDNVKC